MGGNKRMGVFATRSPFRPNELGLSSVELTRIDLDCKEAPVLYVKGADILDKTPIFDIKPYLAYTDSHPEAKGGFAEEKLSYRLSVKISDDLLCQIPESKRDAFISILENDPRPAYQEDAQRVYKMTCMGFNTEFKVSESTLEVINIAPEKGDSKQ